MSRQAYGFGRRPISGPKIENFTGTKCYFSQFYIRLPNFRILGSIIKKIIAKSVDPLNSVPSIF